MQAYRDSESILQKEIRLMKLPFKGLSYHTSGSMTSIFTSCSKTPHQLGNIPIMSVLNCIPKTYNNTLLVLAIKLLEIAYEDPSQQILRKMKQIAYDEDVMLTTFIPEG